MTEKIQIDKVFDHEVVSLTKALTGLNLKKAPQENWRGKKNFAESIRTKGNFDAVITCQMEQSLFYDIILRMHGGTLPTEQETVLYINEYMNIICGRALSAINNITGNASRLSVPMFHGEIEGALEENLKKDEYILLYEAEEGLIRFIIQYTFQ